jgi:serine/threonine-protein kinase
VSEIAIGTVLKRRYRIDAKLGEGGMAVVYRAFDMQRRVPVALKLLKPDYAEDTAFVQKFQREARNLQRLSHPNIVRFYEFEEDRDLAFMVLDFIDGPTLRKIMRQRGQPLTPGEVLGYLRPICAALSYAHSERVVHCDMKPANVMVDHTGRVFVNDFGIARISESSTVTFSTPGTAAYMAPEQWRGGEDVYPATDVYALGIMLYELLASKQPYTGETAQTKGHNRERLMWEHLHAIPQPASQINPHLPPAFDNVLLKCLAKDPADRYQSVDEFLVAFEAACQQANIAEVPVPIPPPALIESVVTVPASQTSPAQPVVPTQPTTSPSAGKTLAIAGAGMAGLLVVGFGVVVVALVLGFLVFGRRRGAPSSSPTPGVTAVPTIVVVTATPPPASPTPVPTPTPPEATPTTAPVTVVSPGGWRIAFASDQTGADSIWTIDQDGNNPLQITSPSFGLSDWHPEWCDSDRTILFERGDHIEGTTNQNIYQAFPGASPGSESRWNGVPGKASLSGSPACGVSGNFVLFGAVADLEDWRLFFFSGGQSDVFGPGYEKLGAVALSNDGRWAAFSYRDPGDPEGRFRLFKAPVTDPYNYTSIQPVGVDNVLAMSWSPDGRQLAYVCQAGNKVWQLCISDSNGGSLVVPGYPIRYTENSRGNISALAGSPSWSPDGRWIAYASNGDGDWDIYVIGVSGGGAKNLTDSWVNSDGKNSNEMMPSWSK